MSRIRMEIFDGEIEVKELLCDSKDFLVLEFSPSCDGFVQIGELAARLEDGACSFDLRVVENGSFTPELYTDNERVALPDISKFGKMISVNDCTVNYVRAASQRERALEKRVKLLESTVTELYDKIYGSTIL